MKKRILLIPLGGTIAASVPDKNSPVYLSGAAGIEEVLAELRDLKSVAEFEIQPLLHDGQAVSCHSSSLQQEMLLNLSRVVSEALLRTDVDAVIVTQGTDTLEETAFLLQLTVQSPKPVVLTGAMRPSLYGSPDGPDNLRTAVKYILDAQSESRGVVVAFQFQVFSGFNLVKVLSYPPTIPGASDDLPCPFISPAFGPIAEIVKQGPDVTQWKTNWHFESRFFKDCEKVQRLKFDITGHDITNQLSLPMVPILPQYLGNDSSELIRNWYLKQVPKVQFFILEGNGNGSISDKMKTEIRELKKSEDLVFIRSSKLTDTWCIDDEINYPGTLGSRILTSVQARLLIQLYLLGCERQSIADFETFFKSHVPTASLEIRHRSGAI